MLFRVLTSVTLAVVLMPLTPAAAAARADRNCYEDIGCPWKQVTTVAQLRKLSCQNLSHVRNHTYYENYYCFHSAAAKASYGNAGCKYQITAFVPLNASERTNMARIKQVEHEKECR